MQTGDNDCILLDRIPKPVGKLPQIDTPRFAENRSANRSPRPSRRVSNNPPLHRSRGCTARLAGPSPENRVFVRELLLQAGKEFLGVNCRFSVFIKRSQPLADNPFGFRVNLLRLAGTRWCTYSHLTLSPFFRCCQAPSEAQTSAKHSHHHRRTSCQHAPHGRLRLPTTKT
jgi:hypothetical protein